MQQIKVLKNMIDSDKLIFNEIKRQIGLPRNEDRIEEMFCLKDKIQYLKADDLLKLIKDNFLSSMQSSDADKLIRIETQLDKNLKTWYDIQLFMSTLKRKPKKVEKIIVANKTQVQIDMTNLNKEMKQAISLFNNENLPFVLGKLPDGSTKIVDLTKLPHLLVAGQTGSGKSVFLNSIIISMLNQKNDCKLVLVDPKRVEFSLYKRIPQLFSPVVSEVNDADKLFESLIKEMESRFSKLETACFKNLESFNKSQLECNKLPYIVIVIDEFADLMLTTNSSVKNNIIRLASLSRAVGMHIVMATQRPVAKIIEGLIKSNMSSRVSFKVASRQDSKIILDRNGAEKMNGNGDMLFLEKGDLVRCQGFYISDEEIKKIVGK